MPAPQACFVLQLLIPKIIDMIQIDRRSTDSFATRDCSAADLPLCRKIWIAFYNHIAFTAPSALARTIFLRHFPAGS
jgi:hypothetical protein